MNKFVAGALASISVLGLSACGGQQTIENIKANNEKYTEIAHWAQDDCGITEIVATRLPISGQELHVNLNCNDEKGSIKFYQLRNASVGRTTMAFQGNFEGTPAAGIDRINFDHQVAGVYRPDQITRPFKAKIN